MPKSTNLPHKCTHIHIRNHTVLYKVYSIKYYLTGHKFKKKMPIIKQYFISNLYPNPDRRLFAMTQMILLWYLAEPLFYSKDCGLEVIIMKKFFLLSFSQIKSIIKKIYLLKRMYEWLDGLQTFLKHMDYSPLRVTLRKY